MSETPDDGGAIYVTEHNNWVVMTNVSINAFFATRGAGVFLEKGNTLIMRGSTVSQCVAATDGGGIYLSPSSWLFMLDTTVANNTAVNGGGGISLQTLSTAVAMSTAAGAAGACAISGNAVGATGQGGGVYVSSGGGFWASSGCSVSGNQAETGGGVFAVGGDAAYNQAYASAGLSLLSPDLFADAAADAGWAAANAPSDLRNAVSDTVIWNIFADSATFSGNVATLAGGAAYCGADALCGVQNTLLTGNSAGTSGAGLYALGAAQVETKGLQAVGNAASAYGGALYLSGVSLAHIAASTLSANSAGVGGGALYVIDSPATVNDTVFSGNVANGALPRGGAVYLRDAGAVVFGNCSFAKNAAAASTTTESSADVGMASLVERFGAFQGGALSFIAASAPVNVSLVDCSVVGNSAMEGGAVAAQGSTAVNVALLRTAFVGNTATQGGVFTIGETANVSIDSCSFTSNVAEQGAIFVVSAVDHVPATVSSVLANNTALNYGPVFATLPVSWTLQHPPVARTGAALQLQLQLFDLFAQNVTYWRDAVVSASASNLSTLLSGTTAISYVAGSASFTDLLIHGVPSHTYPYTVSIESPTLALQMATSQQLNVTIEQCNFAEVFNPSTLTCECVLQATYDEDSGSCICAFAFYMDMKRAKCAPCPLGAYCPGNNLAYPVANYWHVPYNWTRFYECEQGLCEVRTISRSLHTLACIHHAARRRWSPRVMPRDLTAASRTRASCARSAWMAPRIRGSSARRASQEPLGRSGRTANGRRFWSASPSSCFVWYS